MIGATYKSPAYTVDDATLSWFASWSLDFARLHTDARYAQNTIFGKPVGHGMLGLCLAEGLLSRAREEAVVFSWHWTFVAPFFVGDTIWAEAAVLDETRQSGLIVRTEAVNVFKNDGEIIQRGQHKIACADGARQDRQDWYVQAMSGPGEEFAREEFEEVSAVPPSTSQPRHMKETGVFYEDRPVGYTFSSPAYTIGEIYGGPFAGLTGESASIFHRSVDGQQYVLPVFGFALVEGLKHSLSPNHGVGTPMASLSWRWHQAAPLFVGDTVYLDARIDGRRASLSKTDRGIVSQSLSLVAAGRGEVQRGQHAQMFRRRAVQAAE